MKKSVVQVAVLAIGFISSVAAFAGTGDGGGGDPCQARIEEIRNNTEAWIELSKQSTDQRKYGSAQLDFAKAHTDLATYNSKMTTLIDQTRLHPQTSISCTDDQSKVTVGGAEKLCVSKMVSGQPNIVCYRGKTQEGKYINGFLGAPDETQYFQVHHEFAVLAGFEDQTGYETNYPLSPQISEKLKARVVKQLPVLPEPEKIVNCTQIGQAREASERLQSILNALLVSSTAYDCQVSGRSDSSPCAAFGNLVQNSLNPATIAFNNSLQSLSHDDLACNDSTYLSIGGVFDSADSARNNAMNSSDAAGGFSEYLRIESEGVRRLLNECLPAEQQCAAR